SAFPLLLFIDLPLNPVVEVHEGGEPAEETGKDREEGPGVDPTVHEPAERTEQQNGEGEGEALAEPKGRSPLVVAVCHQARKTYPLVKNFASKPQAMQPYVALGSRSW